MMNNIKKKYLYELLYFGLIEIRERAYETEDKKIFWISNLLHNLPMGLMNAKDEDFEKIFADLENRAKGSNWLKKRIEEIDKNSL